MTGHVWFSDRYGLPHWSDQGPARRLRLRLRRLRRVRRLRRARALRRRLGRWGGWGGWGGYRDHDEHGYGGYGEGFFLRALLEQLDASPAQEKVIVSAVHEIRDEGRKHREELKKTRADIAKAMRSASFDEVLFGELFARHDTAMEQLRKTAMGALGKVHEALDEKQRERLAE